MENRDLRLKLDTMQELVSTKVNFLVFYLLKGEGGMDYTFERADSQNVAGS